MKIFYILNGSNDLYESILKNLNVFLSFMTKRSDLEGYCIYKIENCDYLNIWNKGEEKSSKIGIYKVKGGIVSEVKSEDFFIQGEVRGEFVKYIDVEKFLNVYMKDSEFNIVLISGHGGPFQALLDMKESVAFSMNTYNLANILNKRKIDYLVLDMCSMNYIEVLYEILYKNKVKNLITYRSFAPIEGIDFKDIFKCIESNEFEKEFKKLDSLLICLNKASVEEFDLFRISQNKRILKLLYKKNREFKSGIYVLRTEGIRVGIQTKGSERVDGDTTGYIKYFLKNKLERNIYSMFKYTKDNLWNIVVRGEFKIYEENIKLIELENEGLENIIMQYVEEDTAHNLVEKYLEIKDEKRED
ncbi:MAG: clostripain-related cysteine peptidase [Clostridium sp.]|uniref:clostripain-related cysteine peptidase n=1 Tax=Clostridium sp. TaxID=1506 RepID=UPI003EE7DD94